MDDLPLTCNNINIHSWISTIQNILILQHHCMFYVLPATVATSYCRTLLCFSSSLPRSRNPSWTEVPSTCLGGWTSGGGRRCRCPGGRRILKGNKFDSVCLGINDIILKQLVCYQQGFYAISWGNIIFEVHLVSLEQKKKKTVHSLIDCSLSLNLFSRSAVSPFCLLLWAFIRLCTVLRRPTAPLANLLRNKIISAQYQQGH